MLATCSGSGYVRLANAHYRSTLRKCNDYQYVILLDIEEETPATYPWKTGVRRYATHSKKSTQTYLQTKPHQNVQIASLLELIASYSAWSIFLKFYKVALKGKKSR